LTSFLNPKRSVPIPGLPFSLDRREQRSFFRRKKSPFLCWPSQSEDCCPSLFLLDLCPVFFFQMATSAPKSTAFNPNLSSPPSYEPRRRPCQAGKNVSPSIVGRALAPSLYGRRTIWTSFGTAVADEQFLCTKLFLLFPFPRHGNPPPPLLRNRRRINPVPFMAEGIALF